MKKLKLPTERQYWKEISCIVAIKCVAIAIIWYFCFSHPLHLTDAKVVDHYFTATPNASFTQSIGNQHGH